MHVSLRACHVLLDRQPLIKHLRKRCHLVTVNLGQRIITQNDEQSDEEESEIVDIIEKKDNGSCFKVTDKNDVIEKTDDSLNNDASVNQNIKNDSVRCN